jgi:hypothetical protein
VASANKGDTPRPAMLTYKGARVLVGLEHMMEDASRAMPATAVDAAPAKDERADAGSQPGAVAQAGPQRSE